MIVIENACGRAEPRWTVASAAASVGHVFYFWARKHAQRLFARHRRRQMFRFRVDWRYVQRFALRVRRATNNNNNNFTITADVVLRYTVNVNDGGGGDGTGSTLTFRIRARHRDIEIGIYRTNNA